MLVEMWIYDIETYNFFEEGGLLVIKVWNKIFCGKIKCLFFGFFLFNYVINNLDGDLGSMFISM